MKPPKSEPYQRSRHRATLQAWVMAATAVAAIGLPNAASAEQRDNTQQVNTDDQTLARDAQSIASYWIDALMSADADEALSMMRLPSLPEQQLVVHNDLAVLSDLLAQEGVRVDPVEHRRAGHWALSAWQMNVPDVSMAPVVEPIMLYHPSADGLFESTADWQVVPQGVINDPAIKPLYNADYDALQDWYQTLL